MPAYTTWMNVLMYQAVWFTAVLGRESLVAVTFVLIAVHLLLTDQRARECQVMLAVAAVGVAVDSALTLGGVFVFDPPASVLPIPLWLLAIWLAFAGTLRHALAWFIERPPLCIAAAAIGGPLSYLAAGRLGAVSVPLGQWQTGLLLFVVWTLLMGVLIVIVRRLSGDSVQSTAQEAKD